MSARAPSLIRHGPLTAYLLPLSQEPDLAAVVSQLPPDAPVVWLDSARQHPVTGRWSLLGWDPWLTFTAGEGVVEVRTSAFTQRWRAHPLEALRDLLRRYQAPASSQPQGRALGLLGFASYDLNRWIERLPSPQPAGAGTPDLLWFGMRTVLLVDHAERCGWLFSLVDPHRPAAAARRQALAALEAAHARILHPQRRSLAQPARSGTLEPAMTRQAFEGMVRKALAYIRAGEIFQANLSQRFAAAWEGPVLPLYHALRAVNPSPFACLLSSEALSVISCSPERLVRVQDGRIDTRPIAGTRPRGATPEADAVNSLELLLSEKERAEHVMLVDLARNDLGRVCTAGSVGVTELMTLESYSHVIHIVSDVSGQLRHGTDAVDVLRAVFPGGTITGCPKVRCMQLLRQLEPVARGLYTGSLGWLGFDGTMDLNIAIRTMVLRGGQLSFHAGAGIVADSDPAREYDETLAKAAALISALRAVPRPLVSSDAVPC